MQCCVQSIRARAHNSREPAPGRSPPPTQDCRFQLWRTETRDGFITFRRQADFSVAQRSSTQCGGLSPPPTCGCVPPAHVAGPMCSRRQRMALHRRWRMGGRACGTGTKAVPPSKPQSESGRQAASSLPGHAQHWLHYGQHATNYSFASSLAVSAPDSRAHHRGTAMRHRRARQGSTGEGARRQKQHTRRQKHCGDGGTTDRGLPGVRCTALSS